MLQNLPGCFRLKMMQGKELSPKSPQMIRDGQCTDRIRFIVKYIRRLCYQVLKGRFVGIVICETDLERRKLRTQRR